MFTGVSSDALMLALRDHGAELNPEEWLSLIRARQAAATARAAVVRAMAAAGSARGAAATARYRRR